MQRAVLYVIIAIVVAVPGALLASVLVETEEDQVQSIVDGLEQERLSSVIDHGSFEAGLVVSVGSEDHTFEEADREAARELLDELTGIGSADRVRVHQRQVTVDEGSAEAVLNLEIDNGFVALRLRMVNSSGEWLVESVRVMS
jgi:hypothetical protein